MNKLSFLLATIAIVIALLSLYLGNLKRADIQMIVLSEQPRLMKEQQRRDQGPPVSAEISVPVAIVNSGARAGVMTELDVKRKTDPFVSIEGCNPDPNWRDGFLGALPVAAGESRAQNVEVAARFPDGSVEAWRIGEFQAFDVVLTYSYIRGARYRRTAHRKVPVHVSLDGIVA